jgi:hypothetical protein
VTRELGQRVSLGLTYSWRLTKSRWDSNGFHPHHKNDEPRREKPGPRRRVGMRTRTAAAEAPEFLCILVFFVAKSGLPREEDVNTSDGHRCTSAKKRRSESLIPAYNGIGLVRAASRIWSNEVVRGGPQVSFEGPRFLAALRSGQTGTRRILAHKDHKGIGAGRAEPMLISKTMMQPRGDRPRHLSVSGLEISPPIQRLPPIDSRE